MAEMIGAASKIRNAPIWHGNEAVRVSVPTALNAARGDPWRRPARPEENRQNERKNFRNSSRNGRPAGGKLK
jgi:hypothetical protein